MQLLKQLNFRQLIFISTAIPALLALTLLLYLVKPSVMSFLSARSSFALLSESTENGAGLDAQLTNLRTTTEVLERELHGDMANLPVKQMEAFIIGRLQSISWNNDIQLVGVEPTNGSLSGEFSELLFDVELHGKYLDMFAWLEAARAELGFVVIKQFEMAPMGDNAIEDPELRVNLTMASYRRVTA